MIEKRFWKGIIVIICFALGLSIAGCSNQSTIKSFGPQQAAGQGDVVNDHGQVYNIDKLEGFLDSADHGIVSKLRMIDYTTEGDPVIHVLAYNGQTIDFSTDNSQDKFAEPIKAITH
ncbi:DUF4362 domain-containing protein [Desulfosporosinus sp. PR]|nr:DUF4362 domain-containing protein [Desulfosporosinus sp. PR]